MQISYHPNKNSKITKLKKKKNFFLYRPVCSVPAGIARNCLVQPVQPVFFPVRNRGVERTGLLAGTVYSGRTGRYDTELTTLVRISYFKLIVSHINFRKMTQNLFIFK